MNALEKSFKLLVEHLEATKEKGKQIQNVFKNIQEIEVPEEYRRALRFYQSLSGDSRELLFRLAKKPNMRKRFIKKNRFEGFGPVKNYSSLSNMKKD